MSHFFGYVHKKMGRTCITIANFMGKNARSKRMALILFGETRSSAMW